MSVLQRAAASASKLRPQHSTVTAPTVGSIADGATSTALSVDYFTAALNLNPNNARAWYELGMLLGGGAQSPPIQGTRHTQRECFEVAARIDPTDASAWYNLGVCLGHNDGTTTSIVKGVSLGRRECFEQSVRYNAADPDAWYNLGVSLDGSEQTNRLHDTYYSKHQCFEACLRLCDSAAAVWYNLGVSLPLGTASAAIHGRTYTPKQCFEEALLRDPKDADAWYSLGCALDSEDCSVPLTPEKKTLSKQQCFELTLRITKSQHKESWFNLGVVLMGSGEGALSHAIGRSHRYSAQECFEEVVLLDPMWSTAWYNLGLCVPRDGYTCMIKGHQFSATQCFEISLRIDSTAASAWAELGMALDDGCYSSAIDGKRYSKQRCFEAAVEREIDRFEYWYLLARTLKDKDVSGVFPSSGSTSRSASPLSAGSGYEAGWKHTTSHPIRGVQFSKQQCLERAIALNPTVAVLWNDLGVALPPGKGVYTGDIGGCRYAKQHCFEASLRLDGDTIGAAPAWYNLAVSLRVAEADDDVTTVVRTNEINGFLYTRRECLERALALDPTHAEAWLQLGAHLVDTSTQLAGADGEANRSRIQGELVGKQQCFERALNVGTLAPMNASEAWNRLGVVLPTGSCATVEGVGVVSRQRCFEMSLSLHLLQAEAWYNLGVALPLGGLTVPLGGGKLFNEQECFEQALRLNDHHPAAWYNLGAALPSDTMLSNQIRGVRYNCEACFIKTLLLDEHDADAWNRLGACYLRKQLHRCKPIGAPADASIGALPPGIDEATATLDGKLRGVVVGSAQGCFERAVLLADRHAEAWVNLGRTLQRSLVARGDGISSSVLTTSPIDGRRYTHQECFERAIQLNPRQVSAWFYLGSALDSGATTEDVGGHCYSEQECFEQVLRFDPCHAEAWYNVGVLLGDATHHRQAARSPNVSGLPIVATNDINGCVYTKQACFELALYHANHNYPKAWYYLGVVLRSQQQRGYPYRRPEHHRSPARGVTAEGDDDVDGSARSVTAQECFERALQLDPADGKAWCELGLGLSVDNKSWSADIHGRMYNRSECFEQALSLKFDPAVHSNIFMPAATHDGFR